MRHATCFLLLLLLGAPVMTPTPQGNSNRLRTPSITEYLTAIPAIMDQANADGHNDNTLPTAIYTEFRRRYAHPEEAPFDHLLAAYRALGFGSGYRIDERETWNHWLILAWLNAQEINLANVSTLQFADYTMNITPRDFNADGQNEWILDVRSPSYNQLLVAQQISPGEYRLIDTPLPFFAPGFGYQWTQSGLLQEQLFDDLNGDGLPEWVLAVGGFGANQMAGGFLYVLQWQDGRLVDLAPPASFLSEDDMSYESPAGGGFNLFVFPYGVHVEYADVNHDGRREIVIVQRQSDNWGCSWTQRRIFAWDGQQYSRSDTERAYDPVQGCEFRAAEEAMWAGDFLTAIEHYEHGLTLKVTDYEFIGDPVELARYAAARLALAETFTGRDADASAVMATLGPRDTDSPTLANFIAAIRASLGEAAGMCHAAYEVFNFTCPANTDACLGSPLNSLVGQTIENSGYGVDSPNNVFPSPVRAGCDPAMVLNSELARTTLRADVPPAAQLENLGFSVESARHFDLNGDGIDEWLVWLNLPIPALFFSTVSGGTTYQVTFAAIPRQMEISSPYEITRNPNPYFDPNVTFATRPIPDRGSSSALVGVLHFRGHDGFSIQCPPYTDEGGKIIQGPAPTIFALWEMIGDELQFRSQIPSCQPTQVETVFGVGGQTLPLEIAAWGLPSDTNGNAIPTTYRWNTNLQAYEISSQQPVPESTPDYTTSLYATLRAAQPAIFQGDDDSQALQILDTGLSNPDLSDDERTSLLYLRGFALELLGRTDEALAQYTAIAEAAPESAWGMLAALHFSASQLEPIPQATNSS